MKRFFGNTALVLFIAISMIVTGCGPKPIQKESTLDTPDYHVNQGKKLLERGDLDNAKYEFDRASKIDLDYGEAYSGLALVAAYKEDFKTAFELADKGISKDDGKNPWTYVVRGRIYSMERDDKWIKKADKDFEKAVDIDSEMPEAYYWWGVAKMKDYDFRAAESYFSRTIAFKDGDWATKADADYQKIQKINRAAPGSRVGKKIALIEEIDRADLAVLFLEELKLVEILEKNRPVEYDNSFEAPTDYNALPEENNVSGTSMPSDVTNHWAKTWIKQIIDLGIMEVSPDNKWYPDSKITRAEYALFVQNIIIDVMHDENLATKYIGETSRFKDMRSNTATYNGAALCVDRGIMDAELNGTFKPSETVSGADALLIIRKFQQYLTQTF